MVSLCRIEGLSGQTVMPQCLSSAWKEGSGWLHNNQDFNWPIITNNTPRDWSFITGRGGATKLENPESETFCAPSGR